MSFVSRWWVVVLVAWLAAGCGGGGDVAGSSSPPAAVVRIEIAPSAAILTAAGSTKQLTARAFDADGHEVAASFTWASTRPATIGVTVDGLVTAHSADGSAQITATAAGAISAPVLAVATTLAAGAVALTDAQIVGDPTETTPDAAPSFDNTYSVNLTGVVAPTVGSLLINTEGKVVAGRVVAVDGSASPMKVTLALASVRELFPNLNLAEVIDLGNAPVTIAPNIAALYDVQRNGDLFEFTPKPGASFARPAAAGRKSAQSASPVTSVPLPQLQFQALPPFDECSGSFTGGAKGNPTPFSLAAPPVFSYKIRPSLDVVYTAANGLERLLVKASPTVKFETGVSANATFEGSVECTTTILTYTIPPPGPLGLLLAGSVPVGIGLEFGGKVTAATIGVSLKTEIAAQFFGGFECPPGADCALAADATANAKATPSVTLPGVASFRIEPSAALFGFAKGEFGNPFLKALRFKGIKAKFGGRLDASFAPQVSQIADTTYKSDYKASLEESIGADQDLGEVLKLLGIGKFKALEFKQTADIGKSPAGSATTPVVADKPVFAPGDTVNFSVTFDPSTVDFLLGIGPYNVKDVLLVRNTQGNTIEVGRVAAATGQTDFVVPFVATDAGQASEFTAFVVTRLLPFDVFSLEVGTALGTLTVTTASLPHATEGQSYSTTLAAAGGTTPYTWQATGLGSGLTLDPQTGVISGVPTATGALSIGVTVASTDGASATRTLPLTVDPAVLRIDTASLPAATLNAPYSASLAASGGKAPLTWSATGLGAGLSLNAQAGTITGTPSATGTLNLDLTVTDSTGASDHKALPLAIASGGLLRIATSQLPFAVQGQGYGFPLTATGGAAPLSWSATGLPSGLSIDASSGVISGTPVDTGSAPLAITVSSADGQSDSKALVLATVRDVTGTYSGDVKRFIDQGFGFAATRHIERMTAVVVQNGDLLDISVTGSLTSAAETTGKTAILNDSAHSFHMTARLLPTDRVVLLSFDNPSLTCPGVLSLDTTFSRFGPAPIGAGGTVVPAFFVRFGESDCHVTTGGFRELLDGILGQ